MEAKDITSAAISAIAPKDAFLFTVTTDPKNKGSRKTRKSFNLRDLAELTTRRTSRLKGAKPKFGYGVPGEQELLTMIGTFQQDLNKAVYSSRKSRRANNPCRVEFLTVIETGKTARHHAHLIMFLPDQPKEFNETAKSLFNGDLSDGYKFLIHKTWEAQPKAGFHFAAEEIRNIEYLADYLSKEAKAENISTMFKHLNNKLSDDVNNKLQNIYRQKQQKNMLEASDATTPH